MENEYTKEINNSRGILKRFLKVFSRQKFSLICYSAIVIQVIGLSIYIYLRNKKTKANGHNSVAGEPFKVGMVILVIDSITSCPALQIWLTCTFLLVIQDFCHFKK